MNKQTLFKSVLLHRSISNSNVSSSVLIRRVSRVKKNNFLICPTESIFLDNRQLESCRKIISRIMKRQKPKTTFNSLIKVNTPYTMKAKNSRMGKGKGSFYKFVKMVYAYSPIFLSRNVSVYCAVSVINKIKYKLKHKCCVLAIKDNYDEYYVCNTLDYECQTILLRSL